MKRPGFLFCICPDPGFILDYIRESLGRGEKHGQDWEQETFWGDESEVPERYWSVLSQPDILGRNRAVVLRCADNMPDTFWKAVDKHLTGFKKGIWPIFCLEKAWTKQNKPTLPKTITNRKFWEVARDRKWIWEHPGLTRKTLPGYLKDWAQKRDLEFTPEASRLLVEIAPFDRSTLDRELEKLELYVNKSQKITPEELTPLNSHAELDIFACLQFIQQGKTAEAWDKILVENEKDSDFVFPLIGLLARETRILWQLRTGQESQVTLPGFVLKKKKDLAASMRTQHLIALWERVLETELRIKTGRLDSTQALEYLVSGIQDIFSPGKKPAGRQLAKGQLPNN
ncbi:MAG: DNA polymerase III subunit delta [Desulfonatronovibrionaceae bacterium]